jgi:hypothetical protein
VSFLATPAIVSAINKSCDTSNFYSMSEEELIHKAVKDFKVPVVNDDFFKLSKLSNSNIISENRLKHDAITPAIFSPPPNV